MKPRLKPAPLTREDEKVWFHVATRAPYARFPLPTIFGASIDADRRDADIMYHAGQSALDYGWFATAEELNRPDAFSPAGIHWQRRMHALAFDISQFA